MKEAFFTTEAPRTQRIPFSGLHGPTRALNAEWRREGNKALTAKGRKEVGMGVRG